MLNLQNIPDAIRNLEKYNPTTFTHISNSFRLYLNKIKINNFRHISNLEIDFDYPVTVITGTNKIGKTSLLLLIACSHQNFKKYDSTKPNTVIRNHTWRDVLNFTSYETTLRNYSYELTWRIGNQIRNGEGKKLIGSRSWTGLGKYSSTNRINAKIKDKEVRLIDLERLLPARNFSNSLLRKIARSAGSRVNPDIEQAFAYIFDIATSVEITSIGSHINKVAYLISYTTQPYSSYNAASGEESMINILVDIFDTPSDSLILIDEIEAGLHPSVQRKLANIIQYVSWHHKKQFILTTHSPSLLAALPQKARKFIDKVNGNYTTINNISVNAAFSKMDSKAYPLVHLYCEDEEAEFIIKSILIDINQTLRHFDKLINIVRSGAIYQVKNDYERHKHNYSQMRIKIGYACIFDGDHQSHPDYAHYHENVNEYSFFLYPYMAPEKFLLEAYLLQFPNDELAASYIHIDHHALFQEMSNLGLAADRNAARAMCWSAFKNTAEYTTLSHKLREFLIQTIQHFSRESD